MLNNFIYSETKELFEEKLASNEVLDEAIVFIEDTKEIWNHGTYFGGNVQAVDTGDVIDDINVEYATKAYIDGLVGDINSVLESIINGGGQLITFSTDNIEYQAEEGMTWGEWVDSKYNVDGFYILNNRYVVYNVTVIYDDDTDEFVNPSDIIKNINYTLGMEPSIIGPA